MADTPKKTTQPADEATPRVVPALHPRFFQIAEHVRTHYAATIPAGVDVDDLLEKTFWSHLASKLRPWDRIEAIAEDGAFYAELLVLSATSADANVVLLNKLKLQTIAPGEVDLLRGFAVSHTPATQWRVVRKSDNREVASGLKSRDEAISWLATNRKAA